MKNIEKAYEAIDMLRSLNLPVSAEQLKAIEQMEKDYLNSEVLPLVEQEVRPLVDKLRNNFTLEIVYNQEEGLSIANVGNITIPKEKSSPGEPIKRQRLYIIKVTFPDNTVSCKKTVWETLFDVVKFAGPERVQKLGMIIMGNNIVSRELHANERYRVGQKEIEPGLYLCTYSSTETKYEQIVTINKRLNLGLIVEKVLL